MSRLKPQHMQYASSLTTSVGKNPRRKQGAFSWIWSRLQATTFLSNLALSIFLATLALVIYGLVVVWSASLAIADASLPRQLLGCLLGFLFAAVVWRYDYRTFEKIPHILLAIDIVLFVLPLIPGLGVSSHGMTGWVQLPATSFRFQPSEIMKLVTIYYIAALASKYNGSIDSLKSYVRLCVLLAIPFLLLLTQDLGTSLIVLVSGACVIVYAGARKEWVIPTLLILILVCALVVATSLTPGLPHILKDYQLKRLTVFIDPSVDPTGDGYNLQQATIAVGSGGFLGKGIGNATQAGSGFLPEAHTDFAFALLSEQFGFLGAAILILLYAWLIVSTLFLASKADTVFGRLVCIGVCAMWVFQVFENIGMCIGIMPITGIPLPFISYGASSMVIQLVSTGMVQSVYRHRIRAA